jgi:hypothetical protein
MKKKYIIGVSAIVFLILLVISYMYISKYFWKPATIKNGIVSIVIADEEHKLKPDIYEYEIGIDDLVDASTMLFYMMDTTKTATVQIKPESEFYFVGETIELIFEDKDIKIPYKVTFTNKVDSSYLRKISNECEVEKTICEIIKNDINFKIELVDTNLIFRIDDRGDLTLTTKNHQINSVTFINEGVAFIYYNLVDIDDRTLYFLNNNGEVVFSSKIIDKGNNAAATGIIEIENNKFLINGTKIVRGFDYQNGDSATSMCEVPKNTLVEFRYEIIYDGLSEPIFNKIKDINAKEYLEIKEEKEGVKPCTDVVSP